MKPRVRAASRIFSVPPAFVSRYDRGARYDHGIAISGNGRVANDLYAPYDPGFASGLPQRTQDIPRMLRVWGDLLPRERLTAVGFPRRFGDVLAARGTSRQTATSAGVAGRSIEDAVEQIVQELERRGVKLLNGPMDRPWGIRTASFRDPAGHLWEVAS